MSIAACELKERRERRLAELDRQLLLIPLPPRALSAAVVVPLSRLAELTGHPESPGRARETRRIEALAMRETIRRETEAGYTVRDVSGANLGYDLESVDGRGGARRLIEVKGRDHRGATVTLTKNESLCALNNRSDFLLVIVQVDGETVTEYHEIPDPLATTTDEGLPFGLEAHVFSIRDLVNGPADLW